MVKLYKNFNISKNHKGSIILIGNFDGVHLGHQKLFKFAESYKKKYNLKNKIFGGLLKIHIVVKIPLSPQRSLKLISLKVLC